MKKIAMTPEATPVSGRKSLSGLTPDPRALVGFHCAFNRRDHSAMSDNWVQSAKSVMDNRLRDICRGWVAIRELNARMFTGPAPVYAGFSGSTQYQASGMFYVVGLERRYFRRDGIEVKFAVRNSCILRKLSGCWRQIRHRGSIENPALLDRCQCTVRGTAE
ncbi:MAG: Cif family virulence factor [Acidiferrobacterales bacterium]